MTTLVLADDHTMLRHGLRRSMEDEGFIVVGEAADGNEAIQAVFDFQPDVVLMDVSMPELDGVEATRRITAAFPHVKVVMLTMHPDTEVIRNALAAGASGYLVKDCSIDEVATAVRQAASGDTDVSIGMASSMLYEAMRIEAGHEDEERLISRREEEVLQLFADGCSTPEVAAKLFISQKTVKNHLASIYEKLDARDRTQAVITAVRMGIVKLR